MDSPPVLFEVGSELGDAYVAAMELAGEYAYAGRDVVVAKVLEILGAEAVHEVHNHHNFAWREEHLGGTYWSCGRAARPPSPGRRASSAARWGTSRSSWRASTARRPRSPLLDRARRRPRDEPLAAAGRFRFRKQVVDGRRSGSRSR